MAGLNRNPSTVTDGLGFCNVFRGLGMVEVDFWFLVLGAMVELGEGINGG